MWRLISQVTPAAQRESPRLSAALQEIGTLHAGRSLQQHIAQILVVHHHPRSGVGVAGMPSCAASSMLRVSVAVTVVMPLGLQISAASAIGA